MVPYETSIIGEQDVVSIMTYLAALTTGKPSKNTLYFKLALIAHLSVTPIFYYWN